jgi:hypothetical protein
MRRKIEGENKIRFREMLREWDYAPRGDAASDESDRFRNGFRDMYNVCFPLIKKKGKKDRLIKTVAV